VGDNIFPPVSKVIQRIEEERPGQGFGALEPVLLAAGIIQSSQILLLPEDVLCVAADISEPQARTLRNYARHIVLTFLGLKGMYDEPEIKLKTLDTLE